jgi:hypothetical protein
MVYINEEVSTSLNDEAKQLGKQIGELMRKIKMKIIETRTTKTRNP